MFTLEELGLKVKTICCINISYVLIPSAANVGTKSDDFYDHGVRAKAEAQALGVNLTVTGPTDFSASEQAPILNAVAVSKPDTLIVAPTDSSALNPELSRIVVRA